MVNRKGLGQANILRTNNNTSTGYGIAYADEVSGHRTVANLTALYALHDWQLSASGDNTDNDAIGQLWFVVNADGNGNGCYYQLKDWSKRNDAAGWSIADYTTKAELQDMIDNIATADEEDITTEGDTPQTQVLKLKDRAYDSLNASGKGYKILRKNWQTINGERKNVLTQDMINEPNTIYEIRYDFDLNGEEIIIQNNCVLSFKGGVFKNGTIHFDNTNINANSTDIIFKNIEVTGTIIEKERYAHWFEYNANHDDWNLISTLFNSPGNVYLEPRTYNVDKSIHTSEFIVLSSNLNVYGCENCEMNANHTSLQEIDTLFLLNNKTNIKFDNIRINCIIGTKIKPPIAHGDALIDSSGLYIFSIYNYCVGITLKNIVINNAAYAVKTSRNTGYNNDVYFKDVTIENCEFICDMPIQGTNYSNLVCKNSRFLSRGTNSGNHAIYVLPIVKENYSKNIYFDNCYFYSPEGDGHIIQIYTSDDTHDLTSVTTFTNCLIEGESGACITASSSAKIMLNNCTLKNKINSICGASGGYIIAYNCTITNIQISKNWELYQCAISNIQTSLIHGNDITQGHPVIIQNCSISSSGAYMIYNYTDTEVPIIQNSIITCDYDGVLSVRKTQQNNIKFINCIINVKLRLTWSPGKQGDIIFSFINCILSTKDSEYILNTGSEAVKIDIVNCSLNGDIINIPALPNNTGTSLKRPTNKGIGQIFFDTTLNKPIWWTGTKWVNSDGIKIDLNTKGNSDNRPVLASNDAGYQYYDTTLNKYIVWNGTEWTNMDGSSLV